MNEHLKYIMRLIIHNNSDNNDGSFVCILGISSVTSLQNLNYQSIESAMIYCHAQGLF